MELTRTIFGRILRDCDRREISIITGPRQVGKTTILKRLALKLRGEGREVKYYDLELPSDATFFAGGMEEVIDRISKDGRVVMIDEFHYLPNATRLFKAVHDGPIRMKMLVSGSSAVEMHKHMKESLAGRRRLYRVYPLSFSEWLPSKTRKVPLPQSLGLQIDGKLHSMLRGHMQQYVIFGGMPGTVHEKGGEAVKELLLDLVATYVQKDVKAILRDEDILSFNRLLALLASREGGLISENGISGELNYSLRQVRKDLVVLNQLYLIDIVRPFFTNRSRELKQTYKTYFFDTGIRNAILNDFRMLETRPDKGALMEAFVLHELQNHLNVSQSLFHWRTREKEEVDFVLVQDRTPVPIEVKSRLKSMDVPSGLRKFMDLYKDCPFAVVLNDDISGRADYKGKEVLFAPHYLAHLIPSFGAGLFSKL